MSDPTQPDRPIRALLRDLDVLRHPPPPFEAGGSDGSDGVPPDPATLFEAWLREAVAAGVVEPHAMTLATVDPHGRPDARVLILKDLREGAWWFATSATTAKAAQLDAAPVAAMTFYWPTLGRQIRLRGAVHAGSPAEAAADFAERGLTARAVVLATESASESAVSPTRAELVETVRRAEAELTAEPTRGSAAWRVYGLRPEVVEFWQADPGRLHRRLLYTAAASGWLRSEPPP